MIKKIFIITFVLFSLASCLTSHIYNPEHLSYVQEQGVEPTKYLINKFINHNIIILGEMHEQKNTLIFIKDSLSSLHKESNLKYFATEFIRSRNQDKINLIINSEYFDRETVIEIYRDFAWLWGYKEYIDIIEEIWLINSKSDENNRIKIIALDYEWKDWSGAINESEINRDEFMAIRFFENYNAYGKAIIHTGFNHSFLNYKQNNKDRMGNILYAEYGDDIFQVCLHHKMTMNDNFNKKRTYLPFYMDLLFEENGKKPFGIDIVNSPMSELRDENLYFFQDDELAVFQDITQGYIVLTDLNNIQHSDWTNEFINKSNFEKAKEIAQTRKWFEFDENINIEKLNELYRRFMTSL